jgi:hypothetical protein
MPLYSRTQCATCSGRHGRGDAGALADVAAQVQQRARLRRGLDAFGHDGAAEGAGQADHAFDDGAVLRVVEHVVHEAAVDLEHVHRQALEVGQRGVAGAEVVQRKAHADALAARQQGRGGLDVGMGRGFEHLDFEVRRQRLAVARQQFAQAQREVGLLQVARRDVDADREVQPVAPPLRQVVQRLRDDPVADARRQAGVLDQRQELQRRDQPCWGVPSAAAPRSPARGRCACPPWAGSAARTRAGPAPPARGRWPSRALRCGGGVRGRRTGSRCGRTAWRRTSRGRHGAAACRRRCGRWGRRWRPCWP